MNSFPYNKQNVLCTEMKDPMDGVYSKAIYMILRYPIKSIIDNKPSNLVTLWAIEVDGRTPRGFIAISEVRSVIPEIITLRSYMVVNHIKNHSYALLVACI